MPVGDSTRLTLIAGDEVATYLAAKGSVALDGVSLTVNDVENLSDGVRFTVNIILHKACATPLAGLAEGATVHIPLDIPSSDLGLCAAGRGVVYNSICTGRFS